MTTSQGPGRLRQVDLLGPQAGGSLSRLRGNNLLGTGSLGRSTSWDPQAGVGHPQGLQHDQCWVGLSGCNLNLLLVCPPRIGIDTMM